MHDPENASLLERLHDGAPQLRKSERKVAELVIGDPSFVVNSTMAAVAITAEVSEPTVMRFCTALGYEGFQAFRLALAQTLALGIPATLSSIDPADGLDTLSTKVFDHTISSLDRSRRSLDHEQIERAVEAILAASALNFAGVGASALIALDGKQKAPLFGIPCTAPADAHQQFMAAAMADSSTVTVVVSNTGATGSMIHVAKTARDSGSTVIAICGGPSPLVENCDIPIIVRTIEDTDLFTPAASRIAALVVMDILATAVSLRRGQAHIERLSTMKRLLTQFRRRFG